MKQFRTFIIVALLAFALGFILFGCQGIPATPVTHPLQSTQQTIANTQHALSVLNVLGIVGTAISGGLFVYALFSGNTLLERPALIGASIFGILVALAFTGMIVLPFAPWILLALGVGILGFIGYELYTKFHKAVPNALATV